MMHIIKHPRWKVYRHIDQIKKRYTLNTKEGVEEPNASFITCLRYLDPQQYSNIVRENENVSQKELWK